MKRINYLFMTVIATLFVSCNDAMDENINNSSAPRVKDKIANYELADGVQIYPILYNNFVETNDVQITSADTTSMSINSALLTKMNVDLKPGNVVSVWIAPEQIPFMRRVNEISYEGSLCKVKTERVEIGDVLKDAHLEFDTEIYTNPRLQTRSVNGDINDGYYRSTSDNVYHPTAIWYNTPEEDATLRSEDKMLKDGHDVEKQTIGYDNQRTIIVEEMRQTRGTCDLGFNFEAKFSDFYYPIKADNDTVATLGLHDGKFKFKGGIHARLDCSLSKGVEKFEVGPYYAMEGGANVGLKVKSELFKKKDELVLANVQGFTSCFWVGPIPVVIQFTPSIVLGTELKGNASGIIGAKISFIGSHHTYACYDNCNGWHIDNDGQPFKFEVDPYFGGKLSAEFTAGLYLKGAVKLYGFAGPTLSIGPYVKAAAEAEYTAKDQNFKASANVKIGLGGAVGAEVKVWNWKLAEWKSPIDIWSETIWQKSFDLNEWLKEMQKANENMNDDCATEAWKEVEAEIEKEKDYQRELDEIINSQSAYKWFVNYMKPGFNIEKEDYWYRKNSIIVDEWANIKSNPKTNYDWNLEFVIWKCTRTNNTDMLQQISEHIAADAQAKIDILAKVSLSSIHNAFVECVERGTMSAEDALKKYNITVHQSIVNDWNNIRTEREKYLEWCNETQASVIEKHKDFFNPWFTQYNERVYPVH